ncbi:MAG: bacterioferritin-associated ferredoxin [Rhodospirillaceae bacterium]|nr:MAG: bacterioferritin-associated ferredoxin [Rhodospirillaceae bacterium]
MYVCICHGISDRQIKQALCQGACRTADVYKRLGVRPQCGRCVSCVREMLARHIEQQANR